MPPAEAQKIKDALIGLKDAKGGQGAGHGRLQGFVAPNPEIETAVIAWLGL